MLKINDRISSKIRSLNTLSDYYYVILENWQLTPLTTNLQIKTKKSNQITEIYKILYKDNSIHR